jgi:phage tail sheath protein FI
MPNYLSPGIYMEEVDRGSKPIESVGTAVAAFVGYTEKASDVKDGKTVSLLGKPTLVTNWSQYVAKFGGFADGVYTPDSVYGYFANGGSIAYIVSVKAVGEAADSDGAVAAKAIVDGDGGKGKLLEFSAKQAGPKGNSIEVEIKHLAPEGEGDGKAVTTTEFTVIVKVSAKEYQGSATTRTGLAGLESFEDVTMIVAPDLMSAFEHGEIDAKGVQAVQQALIDYCELVRYCFAILDAPPNLTPQEVKEWRMTVNYDTTRAALYYPWVEIADMTGSNGRTRLVPPSGHMAGIYARVDNTRGVHKAPANEIVRTALGLGMNVTKGEQDLLTPIGVNCIRSFPGRGIRVWGARTLSSDASWRYINVRRLFNMIEESIERGTQWVVFEPNDQNLWGRVTRDVSAFLKMVWRTGALFGTSPDKAFYVKCDAETNPPEARDVGQLLVEVGIAPVKPAEFVIFRIGQWSPES